MRKLLLFTLITFYAVTSLAQVKGTVIDSTAKKPIDKAVIGLVIKSNIADTIYTVSNEKGEFSFALVPASNFSVIFNTMGYAPIAKFIPVSKAEKTISLGTVVLAARSKLLSEVLVTAAPIVIKEDTVEYNAASFKVKENAMAEDLLKKLPGVTVDKDGTVTAQGKTVTKVKVNGKDFFGGDVKTATRELPANIIDKVQVIDDYGDQANISGIKDGEPSKVINLQLKKDANHGYFGRTTVGAGTEDRYQASFNGNYFNNNTQLSLFANSNNTNQSLFSFGSGGGGGMGSMMKMGQSIMSDMGGGSGLMNAMSSGDQGFVSGNSGSNTGITSTNSIGFNYRDQWSKKISVYGSYSYGHKNNAAIQNTATQNSSERFGSSYRNEDLLSTNIGDNHRFYFNMEYNVDSFNYLKISPSVTYANSDASSNTNFNYYDSAYNKTSKGANNNTTGSKAPNISGDILFNHRFRKRGRNFSVTASLGTSSSLSDQNTQNVTTNYVIPVGTFNQYQFINQDNDNHNYGFAATYSEPLTKYRTLDLRLSHNFNYARNDKKTYLVDPVTGLQTYYSSLSNDYENDFYNDRVGVSVRTTMKKYNYTLGLSLQPVDLRGNSITKDSAYSPIRRVNIFPIARFAYNFTRSKTLNISYRGNATQPSFSQLQDVTDSSNIQYITRGNPYLKPSVTHSMNASYNNFNFISGKVLFTNISFSTTENQIVNRTIFGKTGSQFARPENVNGYYNANGFYTYSKPYKNRKYVITFTGTANYNHNVNLVDSGKSIGRNWILSQRFNFEYNLKEWLELGTGIGYSLNDVHYKNSDGKPVSTLQNTSSNAVTLSTNGSADIPKNWVFRYDLDYTINSGLSSSVTKNPAILNASMEKQLFKKKNGIVKLAAFDLFNQNSNINRSINANSIVDTRSNKLTRYFMLTFTYRIQKFTGKQPQSGMKMVRAFGG
ncbi:MAG: outer membrane beta-barrel protein [Ferruginibacter sp.]